MAKFTLIVKMQEFSNTTNKMLRKFIKKKNLLWTQQLHTATKVDKPKTSKEEVKKKLKSFKSKRICFKF